MNAILKSFNGNKVTITHPRGLTSSLQRFALQHVGKQYLIAQSLKWILPVRNQQLCFHVYFPFEVKNYFFMDNWLTSIIYQKLKGGEESVMN